MPKVTENLRNAQILADFSNLEPGQVDYFRNNFPGFFPESWWDYESSWEQKQWLLTQMFIRESWKTGFGGNDGVHRLVILMMLVFDPTNDIFDAKATNFRPALGNIYEVGGGIHYHKAVIPPYQNAVAYLFNEPWRARFCAECNKRFVAVEPKNKFCGETCSLNRQLKQGREWFKQYNKTMRKRYGKSWRRKRKKGGK
jgi:hypothetical protein